MQIWINYSESFPERQKEDMRVVKSHGRQNENHKEKRENEGVIIIKELAAWNFLN